MYGAVPTLVRMATTCARCGRAGTDGVCAACDAAAENGGAATAGLLAMPGGGDSVWTRVALALTALVTVAIAAALLVMTVRSVTGRG